MEKVDFNHYDNSWYKPGSSLKKLSWYFVNMFFFKTSLPFPSFLKIGFIRLFGGKIGKSCVIKPNVNIKYPWFLDLGNHVWVGESVWIDNLSKVKIGSHVSISQGAYLLTGSHDYKKKSFDLIIGEISLEDGVWVGAKATVCPGVVCKSHSILSAGSVATMDLEPYGIYQGNPAMLKRQRHIK